MTQDRVTWLDMVNRGLVLLNARASLRGMSAQACNLQAAARAITAPLGWIDQLVSIITPARAISCDWISVKIDGGCCAEQHNFTTGRNRRCGAWPFQVDM